MKWLLVILLALISFSFIGSKPTNSVAIIRDTVPTPATPQLFGSKLYEFRNYVVVDSMLMVMGGDTFAIPRWPALKYKTADNRWYGYYGTRWRAFLNGTDTISLSNRINSAGGSGGGLVFKYAASAPTGADTAKLWIQTPAVAGVYNVYTYVSNLPYQWQRFGWLSLDGVLSLKRPITLLICGQSNAGGIGTGGDTSAMPGIIAFSSGSVNAGPGQDYQTQWLRATIGLSPFFTYGGVGTNNIGFQVAKQIKKHGDADIVRVITTYQGGTSLSSWIGSGGNLFLLDTLRSRLNRSGIDTIDIFCWHQGESGGITGFTSGGYVVDQRVLYDTLCSSLTTGFYRNYTKYVAGGPADTTFYKTITNRGAPFAAQMGLDYDGNINTGFASSQNLSNIGDNTHFTGTAIDSLGYKYYSTWKSLPHTDYQEKQIFTWDSTYDLRMADETMITDYNGGTGAFRKIGAGFGWKTSALNRLFTISPSPASGTVFLGEATGYDNVVPKMFQVNGKSLISDGSFNTIISGNWNITGNPQNNVVIANYSSSFTGAAGGDENVVIGYNAGYNATRMLFNSTIIGSGAALNITPLGFGDRVTAVGKGALASGACLSCAFVGNDAGASSQGNNISAFGPSAGALNSTARVNSTSIGANAKYNEDSVFVAGNALKRFIIGGTTSLPFLVGSPTNEQVFAWNSSNSQFELTTLPGLDGNGIYGGSGSLPSDVTVTGGSNGITFTSTRTGTNSTVNINNTSTGRGLTANSTSGVGVYGSSTNSIGILGISTNSTGIWAQSSSADALYAQSPYTGGVATLVANPATTNTVHTVLNLTRASTSPGANNIGGSIDFNLNNTFSAGSVTRANQIISQLTTATSGSETSAFTIKGISAGVTTTLLTLNGNGSIQFNNYGASSFTGTPTGSLQVTAGGDIIEGPMLAAGTYTPTLTNTTNVASSTASSCQYMRVGNTVTVSGKINITPTSTGATALGISLPIASAIANNNECGGTGTVGNTIDLFGSIRGDATNDRAELIFTIDVSGTTSAQDWYFTFTYRIL